MSGNDYNNFRNWIFFPANNANAQQQEQKQPPPPPPDEQKWIGMPIAPPPPPEEYKAPPEQKSDYVAPPMNVQLVPFNPVGIGNRIPASSRNLFGAPSRAKGGFAFGTQKGYPQHPRGLPYELQVERYYHGGLVVNKRMWGGVQDPEVQRLYDIYYQNFNRNPNWNRFEADYANNLYGNPNFNANNVREMALQYFGDDLGDEKEEKKEEKQEQKTTEDVGQQHPTGEGDEAYEEWRRQPPQGRRGRIVTKRSNGGMIDDEVMTQITNLSQEYRKRPEWKTFLDKINEINQKGKLNVNSLFKWVDKIFGSNE